MAMIVAIRKIVVPALCLWTVCVFTGCGGKNSNAGDASSDNPTADGAEATDTAGTGVGTMTFFVTNVGNAGKGGDLGGLDGADAKCQAAATAVGAAGKTWHAYLSSSKGNAKDRIGKGPWFNQAGKQIATDAAALHKSGIDYKLVLTETGATVPGNDHDILTGSKEDGTAFSVHPDNPAAPPPTCVDWTSSSENFTAWVGHADWNSPSTKGTPSWNSSHSSVGCTTVNFNATGGSGRLYCFAVN